MEGPQKWVDCTNIGSMFVHHQQNHRVHPFLIFHQQKHDLGGNVCNKAEPKERYPALDHQSVSCFRRINPFDESKTTMVAGNGGNAAFHEVFDVRFCGSMQVQTDRGTCTHTVEPDIGVLFCAFCHCCIWNSRGQNNTERPNLNKGSFPHWPLEAYCEWPFLTSQLLIYATGVCIFIEVCLNLQVSSWCWRRSDRSWQPGRCTTSSRWQSPIYLFPVKASSKKIFNSRNMTKLGETENSPFEVWTTAKNMSRLFPFENLLLVQMPTFQQLLTYLQSNWPVKSRRARGVYSAGRLLLGRAHRKQTVIFLETTHCLYVDEFAVWMRLFSLARNSTVWNKTFCKSGTEWLLGASEQKWLCGSRLFGFITRTRGNNAGDKATFTCHVFECNTSADEVRKVF